ncbi:MAG: hypothetical protein Q3972_02005 [Corynebacterium sp.]|nr:hypothetical protein [Corynebacterium sp.]
MSRHALAPGKKNKDKYKSGDFLTRTPKVAFGIVVVIVAGAIATLNVPDPTVRTRTDSSGDISIVYDTQNETKWLTGSLYQEALNRAGRAAKPNLQFNGEQSTPLSHMLNGEADLYIACTGELLYELNPTMAEELEAEYASATTEEINSGEWREAVYQAMMASLPEDLSASDPSNAIGCQDSDVKLPQNIVPIYRRLNFDRPARLVLNSVSGTISTDDISELVDEAKSGASVSSVVTEYLANNKL